MPRPTIGNLPTVDARSAVRIPSPRLRAFVRAASLGDRGRASVMWASLVREGVPLVEGIAGNRDSRRVTFVWRPRGAVDGPAIYTPIANPTKGETELLPAGDTGVWWRSFVVPRGTRAMYAFSRTAAPALSARSAAWESFFRNLIADPSHRARFTMAKDPADPRDADQAVSVLSLPGAPPWPAPRAGEPPRLARYSLGSHHLPGRRFVWVDVPRGRPSVRRPLHLVIVFDGVTYQSAIPTPMIVRDLVRRGAIGPTALVLIGNALHARDKELAHNPRFVRFLVDELLPWLRDHHGIDVPAERTVLAGSSLGGLAAAYAALEAPERFGNVLAQSGAFLWSRSRRPDARPALFEEYARAPRGRTRFYLDAGRLETVVFPGMSKSLLDGVRGFRDLLRERGYPVRYVEFLGGHDYACWAATFGNGLRSLIGRGPRSARGRPARSRRTSR
jgi:enterochelin esterase-like enzyme